LTLPLVSQVDRLELSLRLRAVERSLAAVADPAHRKTGLAHIEQAVSGFFAFDLAATARSLSEAELALRDVQAAADMLFANALSLRPKWRLVEATEATLPTELGLAIRRFGEQPEDLRLAVWIGDETVPDSTAVPALPAPFDVRLTKLAEGEHVLHWRVFAGKRVLLTRQQPISVVANAVERIDRLSTCAKLAASRDVDTESLRLLAGMLQSMRSSKREETTLPGAAILGEAEALAAAVASGKPSDLLARPGQHWIAVPSPTRSQVARIAIPTGAKADERLPVVVALHGAGGSENMFFDAYGNGALVQACVERGWFVIAPRCGLLGGVDLPALLEAMATRWPIDRQRVVLVGHSMGAMQAVAAAVAPGANYRAIAALGGGGRVPANARLSLPSFVGIGSRDFARGNALQLHAALQRAGSKGELREYGDVEHLTIVQIATPDVLDFFTAALAPSTR
jgi:pimeloyl-ACP methyl ester carboxylesterase